jgi:adenylate cyclase, class 2
VSSSVLYEVELKFPLADSAPLVAQLEQLGAQPGAVREQRDRYFAHPARDFVQTNEALRIRSDGPRNCLTYKGPVVDAQVKSRPEIETAFADGPEAAGQLARTLGLLGFREVRTVAKRRVPYHLAWEGRVVEVTLDDVHELGTFVELETLADESEREAARDAILLLAGRLGLENPERRSYLRLLLEQDDR